MKYAVSGLAIALFLLAGCAQDGGGGQGTVGLAVTDAPTDDFTSINVTFSRAAIHRSGSGDDNGTGNATDNSTSGWKTIAEGPKTVDLLQLHHSNSSAFLGFAQIDAGRYQQVRLYVDKVEGTTRDGNKTLFDVPSGVLRTTKSFEVKAGGNTTLTLEIDLDRSINCQAKKDNCTFRPVLGKIEASEN